jgi:Mor family transcriptional regulator
VVYFKDKIAVHLLFQEEGKLESKEFLSLWRSLDSKEISQPLTTNLAAAAIKEVLEAVRVFHIASRAAQGIGKVMYFSLTFRGVVTLVEVTLKDDHNGKVCLRSAREDYGNVVLAHVVSLLS